MASSGPDLDEMQLLEGSDLELCDDRRARGLLQVEEGAARNLFGSTEEFGNDLDNDDDAAGLDRPVLAMIVFAVMLWGGAAVGIHVHRHHAPGGQTQSPHPHPARMFRQPATPEAYDFVGEGNCLPNRPQWEGDAAKSYELCRATCDAASLCIGFDWDSKWTYCRVRFATNEAARAAPPPRGFKVTSGEEGSRLHKRKAYQGVIQGIEGSNTAACFQKARKAPYYSIFQAANLNIDGDMEVGPFPNIFHYYRQSGLSEAAKGARHDGLRVHNSTLLEYNGTRGAMILPSLDAMPLLRMGPISPRDAELSGFRRVTVVVGVNSDSFNRGLGIFIEASPSINETEEHREASYTYSSETKLSTERRNYIKFHPDYSQGELRVEGPGGFSDKDMGFTPPGWTTSSHRLNTLEVTMRTDGQNVVVLTTPDGLQSWTRHWRHKLFDGKEIPAIYAWMDLGGEAGKPLLVGQVSLSCGL